MDVCKSNLLINIGYRGHLLDESEIWGLTFSRKRIYGRFERLWGAQGRGKEHAPGHLGLHFGRHCSIKILSNIDVTFAYDF